PTEIPAGELDYAVRLITPQTYIDGGVRDQIDPLVALVILNHDDGSDTVLFVREMGHNPAAASGDGRNYFYARADEDIHAGAIQLIQLVTKLVEKQPR